ncbi:DedA family protein [Brachybacterium sacelli]|uniref:Membrane protein DedA with SNARE-associated domain n=1 Tax=Brachybacterium sacelli TaxID=173364 RepID=A0ABS4X720_9MICO|nr:VTT domain-containing protein [Brachybacterium sacelli]MBP2384220.1 membrane protein DedA with SNARE-associated domain [Brachybacterium sacelli]
MDAVLHLAETLLASPWLYVLVIALTAFDGLLPVVPAETVVLTAAAYAMTGGPDALPLLLAAWTGALAGDVAAHHVGRGAGPLARWARRRRWVGTMLGWAEKELMARGGMLIVSARFVPGGRTATTVASGVIGYPRRRFVLFAALAAALWSLYYVGIGMLGGLAFRDQPLLGVALGIGMALAVGGTIEAVRAVRRRRREAVTRPRPAGRVSSPAPVRGA